MKTIEDFEHRYRERRLHPMNLINHLDNWDRPDDWSGSLVEKPEGDELLSNVIVAFESFYNDPHDAMASWFYVAVPHLILSERSPNMRRRLERMLIELRAEMSGPICMLYYTRGSMCQMWPFIYFHEEADAILAKPLIYHSLRPPH